MTDPAETHYLTTSGALCGAVPPRNPRWAVLESRTTCEACRALLRARAERDVTKPIGRLVKIE